MKINSGFNQTNEFFKMMKQSGTKKLDEVNDILTNRPEEIKSYEEEYQRVKAMFNRKDEAKKELNKALYDAYYKGEDPINATFKEYYNQMDIIKNSQLRDDEKKAGLKFLEMDMKLNVEMFANGIYESFYFNGLRAEQGLYDNIDWDKLRAVRNDIVNMFNNAFDYFEKNGFSDEISSKIIESNTNTINFKDLSNLNSFVKQVTSDLRAFAYMDSETKSNELNSYIRKKAETMNMSEYTRGLYVDLFF